MISLLLTYVIDETWIIFCFGLFIDDLIDQCFATKLELLNISNLEFQEKVDPRYAQNVLHIFDVPPSVFLSLFI